MNNKKDFDQISSLVIASSRKSKNSSIKHKPFEPEKDTINFFFHTKKKENHYTFMLDRKLKQLNENLKATNQDSQKQEILQNFKYPQRIFGFTNNRKLSFTHPEQRFSSFIEYNRLKENILFNNVQNIYILKLDFSTREYFFSSVLSQKVQDVKFYLSSNFFKDQITNNLILSSQMDGLVTITDYQKQKKVSDKIYENVQNTFAFDKKYACVDEKGFIQFFDIRDDRRSIYHLQMHQFFSVSGEQENPICNDIQYLQEQCLISGNTGTFYYDMRKINNEQHRNNRLSLDINMKVQRGKKFSLTNQTIHGLENFIQSKNKDCCLRKSYLLPQRKSYSFDYTKNTLSLYDFEKPQIQNQIVIQQNIIDFDYNKYQRRIALLEEPIQQEQKVLFMSENFELEETLIIKNKSYQKIGLFGQEGKFILHSKKEFQFFDMEKQVDKKDLPRLIQQLEKKIPKY